MARLQGPQVASGASARTSIAVMLWTAIQKLMAMARELVIAAILGASSLSDAYAAAQTLSTLVTQLVNNGLSTVAVPFLIERDEERERHLSAELFWLTAVVILIATGLIFFFGPALLRHVYGNTPSKTRVDIAILTQWFAFLVPAAALAGLQSARFYARRKFALATLAPAAQAAVTMLGVLLLPRNATMFGLSFVAGAVVQVLLFRLPPLRPLRRAFRELRSRGSAAITVWKLMLPQMVGSGAGQLNLLVDRVFASLLPVGSIAEMTFGSRVLDIPVTVFGQTLATTIYPDLAAAADDDAFRDALAQGVLRLSALTIPIAAWLYGAARPIIGLLYGHGRFNQTDVDFTAGVLQAYAPLLWFRASQMVASRGFYARKDTRTLTILSLFAIPVNAIFDYVFLKLWGLAGIALGTSVVGAMYSMATVAILERRLPGFLRALRLDRMGVVVLASVLWVVLVKLLIDALNLHGHVLPMAAWVLTLAPWALGIKWLMPDVWLWLLTAVQRRR